MISKYAKMMVHNFEIKRITGITSLSKKMSHWKRKLPLTRRVLNWYYANNFSNNSELTVNISKTYLEQLPIPKLLEYNDDTILPLTEIVDHIQAITKDDDYLDNPAKQAKVKELEKQIDRMVYKLYGLTPEEIAIIEGGK